MVLTDLMLLFVFDEEEKYTTEHSNNIDTEL